MEPVVREIEKLDKIVIQCVDVDTQGASQFASRSFFLSEVR